MLRISSVRIVLVLLLVALLAPLPARAQAWLDNAWAYRRPIAVADPAGSTLTSFQVHVVLDTHFDFTKARPDGGDLRVTAADGTTLLPCWIESWNPAGSHADPWVKLPTLPAAGATVYLYYGNAAATSVSSGGATFDFFDDFSSSATTPGYFAVGDTQTVLVLDQAWEGTEAPHTLSAVRAPTGAPWRWYGYYGLVDCGGIGMAGSNDLVHWTKFGTNPLFSGGGERWPSVVLDNGTYYMVHDEDYCGTSYEVLRTSTDGLTWTPFSVIVPAVGGTRNQNPNLFKDPASGKYYLYWFRGDYGTYWNIMARSAATPAGLATAPDQLLLTSSTVLASPNLMVRNGTYYLSTEILDTEWKTRIYSGATPTGPFTPLPGNPTFVGGTACLFQTPVDTTLYCYTCQQTNNVWTVAVRSGPLSQRNLYGTLDATKWTVGGGDWNTQTTTQPDGSTGMVGQGSTAGRVVTTSAYSGTDYVLEGWGRQVSGRIWGFGVRAANVSNAYTLNLYEDLDGTSNLYLYRWLNGAATTVWSGPVGTINPNQWYKLGVKAHGSSFDLYFNDALQASVSDAQWASGPVALYTEAGTVAQWNDVRVRKYASQEPTTTLGAESSNGGNTPPVASITAPANGSWYVVGQTVNLAGTGTDAQTPPGQLAYLWTVDLVDTTGVRQTSTFSTATASFVPQDLPGAYAVRYRIRLKVTDAGGLSDSTSVVIRPEIDLAPSAIAVTPAAPTTADSLTFSFRIRDLGHVGAPATHWTLVAGTTLLGQGDAAVAALDSASVVLRTGPLAAGTTTIRATADTFNVVVETNASNNASILPLTVTAVANQPPVAAASATPVYGAIPFAVSFSSAGSGDPEGGALTYVWAFGDGATSTAANPSHTYTIAGPYTATLTVRDPLGASGSATAALVAIPPFSSTSVLDNFNRSNRPLDGSWSGTGGLTIQNNRLRTATTSTTPVWTGPTFGVSEEAYVTLVSIASTATDLGLLLKVQGTSPTAGCVKVSYDPTHFQVTVSTYASTQGWVQQGAAIPVTFPGGTRIGARAFADGTVEVYRNTTRIGVRSVANWPYAALGGRLGLSLSGPSSTLLDNFGGGSLPNPPATQGTTGLVAIVPGLAAGAASAGAEESAVAGATAVTEAPAALPTRVDLANPYPNPGGRGGVTVVMSLPRTGPVSLVVFDVSGRVVRRLSTGVVEAGVHRVVWDGRSESGGPAAPGLYLIGLRAGAETRTKRVTLLP